MPYSQYHCSNYREVAVVADIPTFWGSFTNRLLLITSRYIVTRRFDWLRECNNMVMHKPFPLQIVDVSQMKK